FRRIARAEPAALARAIDDAVIIRPAAAAQALLVARHQVETSAALWLDLLDTVVRDHAPLRVSAPGDV
ncbi:MAG: hypothetical protein JWO65_1857, partial [Sphingomonas bacterium]|nr:hypothetical protein [Sphingomonas bacterium]